MKPRYHYAPTTLRSVGTCAVSCPSCYQIDTDSPVTVEALLIGIYDRVSGSYDAIAYTHTRYYAEQLVALLELRDRKKAVV